MTYHYLCWICWPLSASREADDLLLPLLLMMTSEFLCWCCWPILRLMTSPEADDLSWGWWSLLRLIFPPEADDLSWGRRLLLKLMSFLYRGCLVPSFCMFQCHCQFLYIYFYVAGGTDVVFTVVFLIAALFHHLTLVVLAQWERVPVPGGGQLLRGRPLPAGGPPLPQHGGGLPPTALLS